MRVYQKEVDTKISSNLAETCFVRLSVSSFFNHLLQLDLVFVRFQRVASHHSFSNQRFTSMI